MVQTINSYLRKVPAWPIYILMVAHFSWLFWLGLSGQSGPDPVKALEHSVGKTAIQVFIAVLAITPLRRQFGLNLIKFRRALGLAVFFYVSMHLLVWLLLDVRAPGLIWADIVKRPYITIGMAAFALLIPLALTSNNLSIRKLGPQAWNKLHKLTYAAVLLGAVHYVMQAKGFQPQPYAYLLIILALLATRLKLPRRRVSA